MMQLDVNYRMGNEGKVDGQEGILINGKRNVQR